MQVLEAIHQRRAVRDYLERPVADETIHALLQAAVEAPSAMNRQPWRFAVIQDAVRLKVYSDLAKQHLLLQMASDAKASHYRELLEAPEFDIFYNAGTLIVICAEAPGKYADADAWLAAENLMLAACDMGLGTCPIGFAVEVLNTPAVKHELHLPPGGVAIAPILVGYPRETPKTVPREAPKILVWHR